MRSLENIMGNKDEYLNWVNEEIFRLDREIEYYKKEGFNERRGTKEIVERTKEKLDILKKCRDKYIEVELNKKKKRKNHLEKQLEEIKGAIKAINSL